jgi:hypothetical protein
MGEDFDVILIGAVVVNWDAFDPGNRSSMRVMRVSVGWHAKLRIPAALMRLMMVRMAASSRGAAQIKDHAGVER